MSVIKLNILISNTCIFHYPLFVQSSGGSDLCLNLILQSLHAHANKEDVLVPSCIFQYLLYNLQVAVTSRLIFIWTLYQNLCLNLILQSLHAHANKEDVLFYLVYFNIFCTIFRWQWHQGLFIWTLYQNLCSNLILQNLYVYSNKEDVLVSSSRLFWHHHQVEITATRDKYVCINWVHIHRT